MKKVILAVVIIMSGIAVFAQIDPPPPPPPPPGLAEPTLKIEGEKVTIITAQGDTYIIDDYGIRKNGMLIVGDSESMRDDIEDLQEEIQDLREDAQDITPDSEE
ncbi:MAG: hypothetical protein ACHQFW_01310, partial [Chitinophagales bacterium]